MSVLKKALDDQAFVCVVEMVPKPSSARFASFEKLMRRARLCGWPLVAALTDRVSAEVDVTPLDAYARLKSPLPALIHFSGKDRERTDLLVADTLYICPETCPKGLANGPCGGTSLNRCEFGDRECVHSVKFRTAKTVRQLPMLTKRLIPCVEQSSRQRSSWPRWFDSDRSS